MSVGKRQQTTSAHTSPFAQSITTTMGGLCTTPTSDYQASAERNKKLESINKKDFVTDSKRIKLLLLGAGESGKSTIFKQMKIIYGSPFPLEERKLLVSVVHSNVISNMRALVNACDRIAPLVDQSLKQAIDSVPDAEDTVLDAEVCSVLKRIWADPGAKQTWARKSEFQIQDALEWYMNSIDRLATQDFIPSVDDILRARVRTSGIVEETYIIDTIEFAIFDVGGQRNERKKWVNMFDNVTSILWISAISEYDQVLFEDDQAGRIAEALSLFDDTVNQKQFRKTNVILFLNKSDLFREKIRTIPIRVAGERFEDFQGPYVESSPQEDFEKCYVAGVEYFLQQFLQRNKYADREVYHHVTNATDTNNVRVVFSACKDIILKSNLRGSGFME